MTRGVFLARQEHVPLVGSTNDVVAGWLADGTPEICLASADEQTAGRGREGRTWQAPRGTNLLLSLGFRPTWLAPDLVWQLAAVASLAMAEAGERAADLVPGTVHLKWPNDLVIEPSGGDGPIRKLAGVLGETSGLGGVDPRAVIGIGVNADWARTDFPADLADGMTSLRETAGNRPVDTAALRRQFVRALEPLVADLRRGAFPSDEWRARQVTSGRSIELVEHDGTRTEVRALDVDPHSGGLLVVDADLGGGRHSDAAPRTVMSGEVLHVRFPSADRIPAGV